MARIALTYRDGNTESVKPGAFAQIAAKRRYGMAALQGENANDPEPLLFAALVESQLGSGKGAPSAEDFDAWLMTVEGFEVVVDETDPPPAENSGEPSPDSPPTSE